MITNPRYQIRHIGATELVGANEQVDQNDYGASVAVTLGDGIHPESGELLSFTFYSSEEGTGAVQTPSGRLLILASDPETTAGDTSITAVEGRYTIGIVEVSASDWHSDANGAIQSILTQPIPFHNLQQLILLWFHTDATSYNDGAGDDEYLHVNAWYRRDT